jgi:hypothetical protein
MGSGRSLDHFVMAVKDLEDAGALYERLGFQVMPQMRHIEIGTINRVFQLHDSYVELLGDIDRAPEPLRGKVGARFACDEGITLVSLTSSDLVGDRALLEAVGLNPAPINNARRKVQMPEGHWDETDSRCVYTWHEQPSASLFTSQHFKPHVIWSPAYQVHPNQVHPNTALRVTGLSYVAERPTSIAPYFSAIIGLPPVSEEGGSVIYRTRRGETVEILKPAALGARFAGRVPTCSTLSAYGIGLTIAAADLAACRALLARNGVASVETESGLLVPPEAAAGTVIEFVPEGRPRG